MGRADNEDIGLSRPALGGFRLEHQPLHADGDAGGVDPQPFLGVVGAQHDHQQIHRLMAHEGGIDDPQAVHALVERIGEHGGAAGQPLLQNQVPFPQLLLQQAGPALRLVKPIAAGHGVSGVGAVAVGIGITEAYDVFFHGLASF